MSERQSRLGCKAVSELVAVGAFKEGVVVLQAAVSTMGFERVSLGFLLATAIYTLDLTLTVEDVVVVMAMVTACMIIQVSSS